MSDTIEKEESDNKQLDTVENENYTPMPLDDDVTFEQLVS
jgi:hypothetical protein